MGNRFGIHGLEAAAVHSERDLSVERISNRPTEVPKSESRSEFGSSCPDPENSQTKFVRRHSGAANVGQEARSFRCPEQYDEEGIRSPHVALPRYSGAQAVGQETKREVSCHPEDLPTKKEEVESSPERYSLSLIHI